MSRRGYPQQESKLEQGHYQWRLISNGQVVADEYPSVSYYNWVADKIGANSPGYPANKPVNQYACYRVRVNASPANWSGRAGYPTPWLEGGGTYPMITLIGTSPIGDLNASSLESRCYSRAVAKLQTKIKDQKVNIGVMAAEFKKTCGTVTSAAQRIAGAIRQVKRGNLGGAVRILTGGRAGRSGGGGSHGGRSPRNRFPPTPPTSGSVARDLLAIQYGWKPLLADVYGAAEELARTVNFRPMRERKMATAKEESETPFFRKSTNNFPDLRGSLKLSTTTQAVIEYEVINPNGQFAANTGLLNPLSVAWELVPGSFIADWFIPVGGFLNNLDYNVGLSFTKGWVNHKSKGSWQIGVVSGEYQGNTDARQQWSGGRYQAEVESFVRVPLTTWPTVATPSFKDPVSLQHAINAIALLRTTVFNK